MPRVLPPPSRSSCPRAPVVPTTFSSRRRESTTRMLNSPLAPSSMCRPEAGSKQAHLGVGTPLDTHLGGHVDKIDLGVEGALCVGGQLVELLQQRELLSLQGVSARTKQVQGLAVPEENGLLALVDNELGAQVEVLNGVLPHQGLIVPLVFDDAGQAILLIFRP